MSVITSWTATPNRMKIVWEFVGNLGPGGVKGEELQTLLGPRALQVGQAQEEGISSGTAIGDQVVTEMRNLGLVERAHNGNITISSSAPKGGETEFLASLENRLLEPVEAERYGQKSFPLALAWLLTQDPTNPLVWGQNYSGQVQGDCGADTGSFELTNVARCQQFVYWARYLGFAWRLEIDRTNVVIPDPTSAIARNLPKVIAGKGHCPIQDVMVEVAGLLPVLEWGTARTEVETRLPVQKQRPEGTLSRSTSFALERLERRGRVVLERPADADAINLDLASGLRPISHVTWRSGE